MRMKVPAVAHRRLDRFVGLCPAAAGAGIRYRKNHYFKRVAVLRHVSQVDLHRSEHPLLSVHRLPSDAHEKAVVDAAANEKQTLALARNRKGDLRSVGPVHMLHPSVFLQILV